MSEIKLTKDNFNKEVLNSDIPVLIDFYANWCGPCKMLSPIISQIAEEFEGKIKVCKVNVDEEMELANKYYVSSIPQVTIIENGKVRDNIIGYRNKEYLLDKLNL